MSQELKQVLQTNNNDNQNLYSHLSNIVSKFLLENPKDGYQILEDYSHNIKTDNYNFKQHNKCVDNSQRVVINDKNPEYIEKARKQLEKLQEGTGEEAQDVGAVGYVPNFIEEARMFELAGVGFGQENNVRINKSLTQLSFKKQAKQVRLWGKILGSQKDYWIAEGIVEGGDDGGELPPDVEPKGQKGVNAKNYWVTNDLLEDWVELPIVTPAQIKISRQIKYIFSGNLTRPVITNPHFDGQEQHLLKCQIVRITATTTIIPAGLYKVNEEEPREIEDQSQEEGFKQPEYEQLQKLQNWVHYTDNILKEGRLVHMPLEIPEGQEDNEEQLKKQQVDNDPFEERLKKLSSDAPPQDYSAAWTIKSHGDTTNYSIYHKEGKQNNGYIVIKSLFWPGQLTVYNKNNWQSLYVGYGFKNSNTLYYPAQPEPVLEEVVDVDDYPEPNYPPELDNPENQENQENQEPEE